MMESGGQVAVVMAPLRQQLSCASMELLQAAAEAQIERLQGFRRELCAVTLDAVAIAKVDAKIAEWELAKQQVMYAYVDQFEAGRRENDEAGRYGIKANR